jgi:hypothetical protein
MQLFQMIGSKLMIKTRSIDPTSLQWWFKSHKQLYRTCIFFILNKTSKHNMLQYRRRPTSINNKQSFSKCWVG